MHDALRDVVRQLSAYLRQRSATSGQVALQAILDAGTAVRAALPTAMAERQPRLRTALTDLHSIYTSLLDQNRCRRTYRRNIACRVKSTFSAYCCPACCQLFLASLVLQVVLDSALSHVGAYRRSWHPALVRLCLFACIFSALLVALYK